MYAYAKKPKESRSPRERSWKSKDAWRSFLKACQHANGARPAWVRTIKVLHPVQSGSHHQAAICSVNNKEVIVKIVPTAEAMQMFLRKHPEASAKPVVVGPDLTEQEICDRVFSAAECSS